jgi:hypothetical protein
VRTFSTTNKRIRATSALYGHRGRRLHYCQERKARNVRTFNSYLNNMKGTTRRNKKDGVEER